MKQRSQRRKHWMLAVVRRSQKMSPRRRPLPGGAGWPKFNQLEMVTTDPVWWRSMYAVSSYCGNRPINKATHKHANRQDRLQYTAPLSLARSVTNTLKSASKTRRNYSLLWPVQFRNNGIIQPVGNYVQPITKVLLRQFLAHNTER